VASPEHGRERPHERGTPSVCGERSGLWTPDAVSRDQLAALEPPPDDVEEDDEDSFDDDEEDEDESLVPDPFDEEPPDDDSDADALLRLSVR
jgi:hypothetical protein